MSRIYLASSWRNTLQSVVLAALRDAGHEVYDFRNPAPGEHGFSWRQVLSEPPPWSAEETRAVLAHKVSEHGFGLDFAAMKWADTVVMLQPCGRSAALELGWCAGAGKRSAVLLADGQEPELMLKVADRLCTSLAELLEWLATPRPANYNADAATVAFDAIAAACGCPHWDYPAQVVRDVEALCKQHKELRQHYAEERAEHDLSKRSWGAAGGRIEVLEAELSREREANAALRAKLEAIATDAADGENACLDAASEGPRIAAKLHALLAGGPA